MFQGCPGALRERGGFHVQGFRVGSVIGAALGVRVLVSTGFLRRDHLLHLA